MILLTDCTIFEIALTLLELMDVIDLLHNQSCIWFECEVEQTKHHLSLSDQKKKRKKSLCLFDADDLAQMLA